MANTERSYKDCMIKSPHKPSNLEGWKEITIPKTKKEHVQELIIEQPRSRRELLQITHYPEKTMDGILSKLVRKKIIKRIKKGLYAYKTYEPLEEKINQAIKEIMESFFKECEEKKAICTDYNIKSLLADFLLEENYLLKQVAMITGNDPKNPEFRKLYFKNLPIMARKVAKKLFLNKS